MQSNAGYIPLERSAFRSHQRTSRDRPRNKIGPKLPKRVMNTVKRHFSARVLLCKLCKSSSSHMNLFHILLSRHMFVMHAMLKRINKNRVNSSKAPF